MLLIPAIDLKDGALTAADAPLTDPLAAARHWLDQGVERLHLVDLNHARGGKALGEAAIRAIVALAGEDAQVQVAGGIRDLDTIERYLDFGVAQVVIGSAAVKSPGFLHDACAAFGGHILVGLDGEGGRVVTDGWSKVTGHTVADLATKFAGYGIEGFVYTDAAPCDADLPLALAPTLALAQAVSAADVPVYGCGCVRAPAQAAALAQALARAEVELAGLVCSGGISTGLDWAAAQAEAQAT